MNKNCEIVQDLLPLYIDDVCSETSKEMIREHLSGCPDCTKLLKQMQDSGLEKQLEQVQTEGVVLREPAQAEKPGPDPLRCLDFKTRQQYLSG